MNTNTNQPKKKGRQGFASFTPERMRETASLGGKAAHEKGTAHEWDQESASRAGRLGGLASAAKRRLKSAGGAAVLLLALPGLTFAQTCEYPWSANHDYDAVFQPGFYRHPYTNVIEVLAVTETHVYARDVQGKMCVSPIPLKVAYSDGKAFRTPGCVFHRDFAQVRAWGRLPEGCYEPSRVIILEDDGGITVR